MSLGQATIAYSKSEWQNHLRYGILPALDSCTVHLDDDDDDCKRLRRFLFLFVHASPMPYPKSSHLFPIAPSSFLVVSVRPSSWDPIYS